MGTYSAFVVDDDPSLLRLLVRVLDRYSITATTFMSAEDCLAHMRSTDFRTVDLPDLILVDLELEPGRMKGQDLIARLNGLDVASEIVAISGTAPPGELEAAISIGASSFVAKPFAVRSVGPTLERLARIGKDRRMYRMRASGPPSLSSRKRRTRPVFLSYKAEDETAANFLRKSLEARGIGVWYAPTTLHPGDEFRKQINSGVDSARVFIAMLSRAYADSEFCIGELAKFSQRKTLDPDLVVIPVILDLDVNNTNDATVRSVVDRFHYIRFERVIDCLTVVLGQIELALDPSPPPSKRRVETDPISEQG